MELKQFLEKFLPNYEQKIASYVLDDEKEYKRYIRMYFLEALQNYTDMICEKQIRICVKTIEDCYDAAFDSLGISELSLEHMPLDFEKAKIESL